VRALKGTPEVYASVLLSNGVTITAYGWQSVPTGHGQNPIAATLTIQGDGRVVLDPATVVAYVIPDGEDDLLPWGAKVVLLEESV
jgi:hypothetical protein